MPRTSLSVRTSSLTPKSRALVVSKIELCEITFQMLRANMMVSARNTTFENRKITLNRVSVRIPANIFANAMIDGLMPRNSCPTREPPSSLITLLVSINLRLQDWPQRFCADGGHVMAATFPPRSTREKRFLFRSGRHDYLDACYDVCLFPFRRYKSHRTRRFCLRHQADLLGATRALPPATDAP